MKKFEKDLFVKKSGLPNAGKGLFTKKFIPKGSLIVEYKGRITTWKEADHHDGANGYLFFLKRNLVIDAYPFKKALARYANDAKGLNRKKGVSNNCVYENVGSKVFIKAVKDIPAGTEILVEYGKEYWDVIKYNLEIEKEVERKVA